MFNNFILLAPHPPPRLIISFHMRTYTYFEYIRSGKHQPPVFDVCGRNRYTCWRTIDIYIPALGRIKRTDDNKGQKKKKNNKVAKVLHNTRRKGKKGKRGGKIERNNKRVNGWPKLYRHTEWWFAALEPHLKRVVQWQYNREEDIYILYIIYTKSGDGGGDGSSFSSRYAAWPIPAGTVPYDTPSYRHASCLTRRAAAYWSWCDIPVTTRVAALFTVPCPSEKLMKHKRRRWVGFTAHTNGNITKSELGSRYIYINCLSICVVLVRSLDMGLPRRPRPADAAQHVRQQRGGYALAALYRASMRSALRFILSHLKYWSVNCQPEG